MNWLETPIAAALARALVHFLWEGTLIAALLAVMLAALRGASAQSRYLAACAAMAAMAASFVVTAVGTGPAGTPFTGPVGAVFAWPEAVASSASGSGPAKPLGGWAVALWLSGVAGLLLRRTGGWMTAHRMLTRAAVAAEDRWTARLRTLRERMGVRREVRLVESALAQGPVVMGWLRPVILVPAGWLMGMPAEEAETVLLHELAHVRRHDYLVNLLQSVVEDVLFYHPAVWWVGRVMRREREHCCDDAAVSLGADRRVYARTLASLEGIRAGEPAMAASGGSLADRIRRILRPAAGPRASAAPLLVAMLLVCGGAAILPAWQQRPGERAKEAAAPAPVNAAPALIAQAAPAQQRREQAQTREQGPYEKWLTQDVAYIIEDRERAAFRNLTTDEEREKFIEQFWARRGTAMKEEHYRRIARANQEFAADIPGWKTDRGRIYIVYGPPDEKETHPSGDRGGPPYEEWLYHKMDGVGQNVIVRFEDAERNGRYRMTLDPRNPRAELARPPVRTGDALYREGPAEVWVSQGGATLIRVASSEVRVTLSRAGGEVVLRETQSVSSGQYEKLLTLAPGTYRLEAEVAGASPSAQARQLELARQLERLREQMAAARQTYTDRHPTVEELRTQFAKLQAQTADAERRQQRAPVVTRLEFRIP